MRLYSCVLILIVCMLGTAQAASRHRFNVLTPGGRVLVESFESCAGTTCPAVVILSGSKGFDAPVYDEIGQRLRTAGLNAYLVHVLSAADLANIASASGARARIAYYAQRLPDWISAVHGVITLLKEQPHHGGKVGILGISLGAQIASSASAGQDNVNALVLVDGGFPNDHSQPVRSLPPLLLIWGSSDRTFPLSIGHGVQRMAQKLGVPVTLEVYEGGAHDFFLRVGTPNAAQAHQKAADFLSSYLSR